MQKKICFLLIVLLTALFPSSCAGNGGQDTGEGNETPAPVLIDATFVSPLRYCIAGTAPEDAEIRIEGGVQSVSAKVTDGRFIAEVPLEDQTSEDVYLNLYAKTENCAESAPLTVTVSKDAPRDDKPVYIGKNNHIHYANTIGDFLGNNLFSARELDTIKNGAENLQQRLIDEGLKTKVIIFPAPNHGTVYPETMPDFLAERKESDNSKLKQLTEAFKDSTVKLINPYERLMAEKENYFLYNRTDTHWNEIGAYFGYCEIFDYIGEFFPGAKPRPLSDFNVYKSTVKGGDLIPMLKFDQSEYTENAVVLRIKNPSVQELYRGDTDEIPYQETFYHSLHQYGGGSGSKPSILMYRDSFSITLMSPMAETAGEITFFNMWDYGININYVKEINPDFLIIEKVERDLGDFFEVFRKFRQ